MNKTILLAAFIFPERLEWFIDYLEKKFEIHEDRIFGYKNLDDESKMIITFKLAVNQEKPINLKNLFPSAVTIHKKGNALYTINAINKLIEVNYPETFGNMDNNSIKINWDNYQDKFILTKDNKLSVLNIKRVF
jgi:hypothetical protein